VFIISVIQSVCAVDVINWHVVTARRRDEIIDLH
jgi:hypothetical protein